MAGLTQILRREEAMRIKTDNDAAQQTQLFYMTLTQRVN